MTNPHERPNADSEPVTELDEAALDGAAGGGSEVAKHPAKVTIPDLKFGIGYKEHDHW